MLAGYVGASSSGNPKVVGTTVTGSFSFLGLNTMKAMTIKTASTNNNDAAPNFLNLDTVRAGAALGLIP